MLQRAKLGKEGNLYTVVVDGIIVGQGMNARDCYPLIDELNESDIKCEICKGIFE